MWGFVKGVCLLVSVLLGILLISNVDKGVETFEPDRIIVSIHPAQGEPGKTPEQLFQAILAEHPDVQVVDARQGIVRVPYGEADAYVLELLQDYRVGGAKKIAIAPTFHFKRFFYEMQQQLRQYAKGEWGTITYKGSADPLQFRNPQRTYPIDDQIGSMMMRSLSYLVPGLFGGTLLGIGLALLAAWRPRLGRWLDACHALLLGVPDFFLVAVLQVLAVTWARAEGHKVLSVMQVAGDMPFAIPFLAILILPAVLVYGALRLAVEREWSEGYIKTAYSKGLTRTMVFFQHILRNTAEDLLAILPRAVSMSIASLVVAEVMCGIYGLGGFALNDSLISTTALPATCAILAGLALLAHVMVAMLRKKWVVDTKEGA